MDRHRSVSLDGSRPPTVEDVAALGASLAHPDPGAISEAGSELQMTVTVLAQSAAEAPA